MAVSRPAAQFWAINLAQKSQLNLVELPIKSKGPRGHLLVGLGSYLPELVGTHKEFLFDDYGPSKTCKDAINLDLPWEVLDSFDT